MICPSCGMTIGVDCFNPQECMAITQDLAERGSQMGQMEQGYQYEIQVRDGHIATLQSDLEAVRKRLARWEEIERQALMPPDALVYDVCADLAQCTAKDFELDPMVGRKFQELHFLLSNDSRLAHARVLATERDQALRDLEAARTDANNLRAQLAEAENEGAEVVHKYNAALDRAEEAEEQRDAIRGQLEVVEGKLRYSEVGRVAAVDDRDGWKLRAKTAESRVAQGDVRLSEAEGLLKLARFFVEHSRYCCFVQSNAPCDCGTKDACERIDAFLLTPPRKSDGEVVV